MESEIPIGKGMCSSSAMIIVFIKIILELIDSPDKDDADKIAYMGYDAEVLEFKEPGGMMDHYTSVYGGLLHIDCTSANVDVEKIDFKIPGKFILFDSLEEKNTVVVLANAKNPVVEGMEKLKEHSVSNIKDLINNQEEYKKLDLLDEDIARKIKCQIDNYIAQRQAYEMLNDDFDMVEFGALIKRHHNNLRDGLNISTPKIEEILNTAYKVGALGGKLNGSGGGGCCYVYVKDEDIQNVLDAVASLGLGYKGFILESDEGMRAE